MELEQFDLPSILEESKKKFPDRKPTEEELHEFVKPIVAAAGLGVGELLALGALLFAIWSHFNPRPGRSEAVCKRLFEGKKCGKKFVHTKKENGEINLWCERKHKTVLRVE
ncbi:MAG: hypothetical protein AB2557_11550 [Candidatus Thiodiazotropha sp.]